MTYDSLSKIALPTTNWTSPQMQTVTTKDEALRALYLMLRKQCTPWSRSASTDAIAAALLTTFLGTAILIWVFAAVQSDEFPLPWDSPAASEANLNQTGGDPTQAQNSFGLDDLRAALHPCAPRPCSATQAIQNIAINARISALESKNDPAAKILSDQGRENRRVRYAVALLLVTAFAALSLNSQLRFAIRHWASSVWRQVDPHDEVNRFWRVYGPVFVMAAGAIMLVLADAQAIWRVIWTAFSILLVFLVFNSRPGFLISRPVMGMPALVGTLSITSSVFLTDLLFARIELSSGDRFSADWLGVNLFAVLVCLTAAHIAVAGFMAFAAACNFPHPMGARKIAVAMRRNRGLLADGQTFKSLPKSPKDLALWKSLVDWFGRNSANLDSRDRTPVAVTAGFSAKNCAEIVEDVSQLLAVNIVGMLLVLALGIDVLAPALPDGALKDAWQDLKTTWLIYVAAGITIPLAIIYFVPSTRLRPFQQAEEDFPDPTPSAAVEEVLELKVFDGSETGLLEYAKKQSASDDKKEKSYGELRDAADREEAVERATGCDKTRLNLLFYAGHYGGGLHEITQAKGSKWVKMIVTILAPAFAAGILTKF